MQSKANKPVLHCKQLWSATGPTCWIKREMSQTSRVVPAQLKSCRSPCIWVKNIPESILCTIGYVLPYTCLYPDVFPYINIARRGFFGEGYNNRDTPAQSETSADTKKKKKKGVIFAPDAVGTQSSHHTWKVASDAWVPCECCMQFSVICCHGTAAHSEWSMKPLLTVSCLSVHPVGVLHVDK